MQLAYYVELLHRAQSRLADAYGEVVAGHEGEVEVFYIGQKMSRQARAQAAALEPYRDAYPRRPEHPEPVPSVGFSGPRGPGLGLLRDLHELHLMVSECDVCWMLLDDAAQGARDTALLAVVRRCHRQTQTQQAWLRTQLSQAAVQALVVA